MSKLVLILLALSLLHHSQVNAALISFNERVYISEDREFAKENSLVYIGENNVTIIGATWTPSTAKLLHDEIKKVTNKPVTEVINTNYHTDRAGGNSYWRSQNVDVLSTQQTHDLIQNEWETILSWTQSSFPEYPNLPVTLPNRVFPQDFEVQQGAIQAIYLGESHTKDGIFVYLPEEKILYGGCILKDFLGNLDFANIPEYPKTLQKLKALDLEIETIISGHGRSIHGIELIDHSIELLQIPQRIQNHFSSKKNRALPFRFSFSKTREE